MSVFIAVVVVLAALILAGFLLMRAADSYSLFSSWSILAFLWLAICLSVIAQAAIDEEERGPCLSYETQMYWNAGTKSMMPARICVQRAEWVKP